MLSFKKMSFNKNYYLNIFLAVLFLSNIFMKIIIKKKKKKTDKLKKKKIGHTCSFFFWPKANENLVFQKYPYHILSNVHFESKRRVNSIDCSHFSPLKNGEACVLPLPEPDPLLQEAVGDHWSTGPPGIQIFCSQRHRVPFGLPCHYQGVALDPQLQSRNRLRHQVLPSRSATQPSSHSPDRAQEA